jgi:two-component system response regulator YesN
MLFKKKKETTFIRYLTSLRMQKAKDLLINSNLKIVKIAEILGFSDAYYFSNRFKKMNGLSPRQFKEQGNNFV